MYKFSQPKGENDIKYDGDCMIRAVVHATGIPYATVYKVMYKHGWRTVDDRIKGTYQQHILRTLDDFGYRAEKTSFRPPKGGHYPTAREVMTQLTNGRYILVQYAHVTCSVDGIILDIWDCADDFVYYAWQVLPA